MITLTQDFPQVYLRKKALLIYASHADEQDVYIESYDIAESGRPINAHPLTIEESIALARCLAGSEELSHSFLQSKGMVPEQLLFTSQGMDGFAVWYTPAQGKGLKFVSSLGIPDGVANIPALVWKASKTELSVYAIRPKDPGRLSPDIPLYHAPFFNIYETGRVCMGTVNTAGKDEMFLEDFISLWEERFFNSNFSHTMQAHVPVKMNIIQLWQGLTGTSRPFPERILKATGRTLKELFKP